MAELWECQEDRINEQNVISEYINAMQYVFAEAHKVPMKDRYDFAIQKSNAIVEFVEVRCRDVLHDQYDTIFLSEAKYSEIRYRSELLNITATFLIRYNDGLYSIDFSETPDCIAMAGRGEMRDSRDFEPVVHFNTDRLVFVSDVVHPLLRKGDLQKQKLEETKHLDF